MIALAALSVGVPGLIRTARVGGMARNGFPPPAPDPWWWLGVISHFAFLIGPAVIVSWILLALSGRRRPVRNWLDVLGRAIGIAWIVVFVINCGARLSYLSH